MKLQRVQRCKFGALLRKLAFGSPNYSLCFLFLFPDLSNYFYYYIHQMEKQNRETRECNFLANQMQTLRFPSLTVPVNSGTTAGRYVWTFKDVFPKGEGYTEKKFGHSSCSDSMNSGVWTCTFLLCHLCIYTKQCYTESCMCTMQELGITSLCALSGSSFLSRGWYPSHVKNKRIKMKLPASFFLAVALEDQRARCTQHHNTKDFLTYITVKGPDLLVHAFWLSYWKADLHAQASVWGFWDCIRTYAWRLWRFLQSVQVPFISFMVFCIQPVLLIFSVLEVSDLAMMVVVHLFLPQSLHIRCKIIK